LSRPDIKGDGLATLPALLILLLLLIGKRRWQESLQKYRPLVNSIDQRQALGAPITDSEPCILTNAENKQATSNLVRVLTKLGCQVSQKKDSTADRESDVLVVTPR